MKVLPPRTYFNVKELLVSAGGKKRTSRPIEYSDGLLVSGSSEPEFSPRMMVATAVSHLLITVNSSVNFAIYCIKVRAQGSEYISSVQKYQLADI